VFAGGCNIIALRSVREQKLRPPSSTPLVVDLRGAEVEGVTKTDIDVLHCKDEPYFDDETVSRETESFAWPDTTSDGCT
jgi:hypothetical protein